MKSSLHFDRKNRPGPLCSRPKQKIKIKIKRENKKVHWENYLILAIGVALPRLYSEVHVRILTLQVRKPYEPSSHPLVSFLRILHRYGGVFVVGSSTSSWRAGEERCCGRFSSSPVQKQPHIGLLYQHHRHPAQNMCLLLHSPPILLLLRGGICGRWEWVEWWQGICGGSRFAMWKWMGRRWVFLLLGRESVGHFYVWKFHFVI